MAQIKPWLDDLGPEEQAATVASIGYEMKRCWPHLFPPVQKDEKSRLETLLTPVKRVGISVAERKDRTDFVRMRGQLITKVFERVPLDKQTPKARKKYVSKLCAHFGLPADENTQLLLLEDARTPLQRRVYYTGNRHKFLKGEVDFDLKVHYVFFI